MEMYKPVLLCVTTPMRIAELEAYTAKKTNWLQFHTPYQRRLLGEMHIRSQIKTGPTPIERYLKTYHNTITVRVYKYREYAASMKQLPTVKLADQLLTYDIENKERAGHERNPSWLRHDQKGDLRIPRQTKYLLRVP